MKKRRNFSQAGLTVGAFVGIHDRLGFASPQIRLRNREVWQHVSKLPEQERLLIEAMLQQETPKEIAKRLGQPLLKIKKLILSALTTLEVAMKKGAE